jgi:hypothetical protein
MKETTMRTDRTRTPANKARTLAIREARRITSARKFMALAFDTPASDAPGIYA